MLSTYADFNLLLPKNEKFTYDIFWYIVANI